jgi:hypothetical protein
LTPLQYLIISEDQKGNYICPTVFYALSQQGTDDDNMWILGDYFLFSHYSIFDNVNNQVGFAKSIAYNWTQSVDPPLFPEASTGTVAMATQTITATVARTMTPTATKTMTPAATKTMTPAATKTMTPTAMETMTPTVAKTMTPAATKTMTPTTTQTMTTMMMTKTDTMTIMKSTTGQSQTGGASACTLSSHFYFFVLLAIIFTHHNRAF